MKQTKKFTMAYSELGQRGDRVQAVVARDVAEFVKFGYEETIPTQVADKTKQFKDILPDMYWEGQKTLKTNAKDECRSTLVGLLGEVTFKAKLALGSGSKEYATFRFSGVDRKTDNELVAYAKHVCQTAEFFKEPLSKRNVTPELITQTTDATIALDDAIDAQAEAISIREQKSVERLAMGNELYELIVELCEVGKRIWEHKNEAFYNDYVLYASSKSTTQAEENEEVVEETTNEE
ncbi:hypothetical protein [Marinifilum fragile]|uniref:hypothetical protein n=1 Tax=Marinifilum fragile TaxID=570161 RepID=UPI0006D01C24|nr:hypothetical protein [Marinifilum fragile]